MGEYKTACRLVGFSLVLACRMAAGVMIGRPDESKSFLALKLKPQQHTTGTNRWYCSWVQGDIVKEKIVRLL